MLKKIISLLLVNSVLFLSAMPMIAQTTGSGKIGPSNKDNIRPHPNLRELLASERSRIRAEKPVFTEEDARRFEKKELNKQVKRNNLSTTAKIGIGVGIAAAIILVVVLATRGNDDPPPPCEFPQICN